jgi:hypothetical protein
MPHTTRVVPQTGVMRAAALPLVVLLAVAGCGGGEDSGPGALRPAADASLAERCGLAPEHYQPTPADAVPEGLAPRGARVAVVDRQGPVTRAVLHVPEPVPAGLQEMAAAARAHGYRIDFMENENFEAELFLSGGGETVRFNLEAARDCPDAMRVTMFRAPGETRSSVPLSP